MKPFITRNGQSLEVVCKFICLGITLCTAGLDDEILYRIRRASRAFGGLGIRHNVSLQSKVKAFNMCVLPFLFYESHARISYRWHVKQLE